MKLAGMFLVAVSCTVGGFSISGNIKLRMNQIESFLKFFDYIIKNITVYRYTVEKIFSSYKDECLKSSGFLDKVANNGRVNGVYVNPWNVSLEECMEEGSFAFKREEYEIIKAFGEKLGIGQLDSQTYHMDEYKEKLEKLYSEYKEKSAKEIKLYRVSGCLIGLFICIMII